MASAPTSLPLRHALLALAVTAVWGSNFVVIHIALEQLPPLLLASLRFLLAFLPAAILLKRPAVPWRNLAAYGVLVGAGQFGLLYIAMNGHITPGLASLVVQMQVFFTIGIAAVLSRERVHGFQVVALIVALVGVGIILAHTDKATTPLGLALVLAAAAAWAGSNIVVRATPQVDMLAYVVWSSLFAVPPLLVFSLVLEGPSAIAQSLAGADWAAWSAVMWQSIGNTLFGYAAWAWLLGRYPVATVAPMALMVPVFGIASSALFLGEPLQGWKLAAAALVMAGLTVNVLWPRVRARLIARDAVHTPNAS